MNFRVLPLTITLTLVLLAFKTGQLAQDGRQLMDNVISPARAEEKKAEGEGESKKEEPEKKEESKPEEAKEGEAKEGGEHSSESSAKEKPKPAAPTPVESNQMGGIRPEDRRFSPQELELLQQLVKRREKLDEWEKNISLKETLLATTEKRIDEKLAQMEELKKELATMLVQYNTQEDTKIKSLVKIYESMKPRDAARIFDEVEMPILLLVIDKMAEKKAAPILASMDPKKAKQLTVELADQRRQQGGHLSALPIPAPTPPR